MEPVEPVLTKPLNPHGFTMENTWIHHDAIELPQNHHGFTMESQYIHIQAIFERIQFVLVTLQKWQTFIYFSWGINLSL